MKIETVAKIKLNGDYEVLYMGADRGEARKVYKANMTKKDEFQSLFHQSGYISRTMSKAGFVSHNESKQAPKKAAKKSTKKKKEE